MPFCDSTTVLLAFGDVSSERLDEDRTAPAARQPTIMTAVVEALAKPRNPRVFHTVSIPPVARLSITRGWIVIIIIDYLSSLCKLFHV
jgi:hypothetical protein